MKKYHMHINSNILKLHLFTSKFISHLKAENNSQEDQIHIKAVSAPPPNIEYKIKQHHLKQDRADLK